MNKQNKTRKQIIKEYRDILIAQVYDDRESDFLMEEIAEMFNRSEATISDSIKKGRSLIKNKK